MNYKRKGHRGRHKKNAMDNNSCRCSGNAVKTRGRIKRAHLAKQARNQQATDWEADHE